MIEFVIYDENFKLTKLIIEKVMMNYDYIYKIIELKDPFNLLKKIDKDNFKVFLLNTEINNNYGITLAKFLRDDLCDWQSMIIFKTSTNNYDNNLCKYRLMYIDYLINEDPLYKLKLENALKIALKNYDYRPNTLVYTYKNTIYNINFSDITYIEKEKDSKRCFIKTNTNEFIYLGNMKNIAEKLDNRFIKCSRSYIINMDHIEYFNTKENLVVLKNNDKISIVSRAKKKELISFLRGLS